MSQFSKSVTTKPCAITTCGWLKAALFVVVIVSTICLTAVRSHADTAKSEHKNSAASAAITGKTIDVMIRKMRKNKAYNVGKVSYAASHLFQTPEAIRSYFTGAPPNLVTNRIMMFSRVAVTSSVIAAQENNWRKCQKLLRISLKAAKAPLTIKATGKVVLKAFKAPDKAKEKETHKTGHSSWVIPPSTILQMKNFPVIVNSLFLSHCLNQIYVASDKNDQINSLRKACESYRQGVLERFNKKMSFVKQYSAAHKGEDALSTQRYFDMELRMNKYLLKQTDHLIPLVREAFKSLVERQEVNVEK